MSSFTGVTYLSVSFIFHCLSVSFTSHCLSVSFTGNCLSVSFTGHSLSVSFIGHRLCRACLHSFFIDRQSAEELRITCIPRDAVI